MTPKRLLTSAVVPFAAALVLTACSASSANPQRPNDPLSEDSPGNPGAVSTVNEYTAPSLGGSFGVPGDPPMGNPALAEPTSATTVTSAPMRRKSGPSRVVPTDIGATGGAGTVSGGAGGSTGTDAPVP